ncbi:MAG: molybdopterin-dependent oxidoreductase [Dehalococcoidia bacterium]
MKLNRREFLALAGKSSAGAVIFAACGIPEQELLIQSPVDMPEDLVRGEDAWYATTWGDGGNGDGMIVRVMQGRAKKVAGNPDFPVNLGKQSLRYDATLQMLYHPDRVAEPMLRHSKGGNLSGTSWGNAERRMLSALDGSNGRLVVVTNPLRGHVGWVSTRFAETFNGRHVNFDPLEQGVLHNAVRKMFGTNQLPDFDLGRSQTILSFGADWLSTWISPVRLGMKYGEFRGQSERGYMIHAEPRMSMTAANADRWLSPNPGTEGHLALGMARLIIDQGWASAGEVNAFHAAVPAGILDGYALEDVASRTGVSADRIREAAERFATHRPSVAFGGGSAAAHTNGSFNLAAIYALNFLVGAVGAEGGITLNPESPLAEIPASATGASFEAWERELAEWRAGNINTVIIHGVDLVHSLPRSVDVPGALANVPNVIAFGTVMNDTMAQADLVLPEKTFLEDWGTHVPEPAPGYQVVGFQQPVVGPTVTQDGAGLTSDARSFGDMLLWASGGAIGASNMRELTERAAGELFDMNRASDSVNAPNASLFLGGVLQRGGWWDTQSQTDQSAAPEALGAGADPEFSDTSALGDGRDFFLQPFQSHSLMEGQLAPTPWAQQAPDPMSSAVWDTWAEINNNTAEEMGIREGDVLYIRSSTGEVEVLAYPHPGVPPNVIGVPMGQGHDFGGRYAEERGANVLSILVDRKDAETGALAWAATRVRVLRAGRRKKLTKFEGNVEAFPVEPGVPLLIVAPGETAHEAEEANHHEYQRQFLGQNGTEPDDSH